ncbi:uncharacterized protein [Physcomitrium patens]|uniref:Peptidase A2 domain-containing protein n=1 Tax=Physcomitrium patens TaxID=3218 RepID=A0A2K1KCK5_PHYPA|nr:uncharacterized protein LOC112284335 [Physcomitrium patens]PNR51515.1 hypothetical protein PHYPA_010702 [Physcomitrium patens]|eukprot:XP_024379817.1 uncharacterized protein LOC112284335 [Physcomitrella patens]
METTGVYLRPSPTGFVPQHRNCPSLHSVPNVPGFGFGLRKNLQLHGRKLPLGLSLRRAGSWVGRIQASSVGSGEFQSEIEALRKMRVIAIKQELDALGVSYRDCFEKEDLVKRLARERRRTWHRLPMRKLKSTAASPKEYIIIPLTFGNLGTFDFLLDTGCSTTLVSPQVAHNKLGILPGSGTMSRGLGGMGDGGLAMRKISLPAMNIGGKLCKSVEGIIMDLASTGLPPSVAGIVGLNVLSQFDVEFDFVKEHITLYEAGAVERGQCSQEGLQKLAMIPISFNLQKLAEEPLPMAFTLPGVQVDLGGGNMQTALIDLGSSLSVTTPDIAKRSGATLEMAAFSGVGVGGQQMPFSRADMDVTMFNMAKDKIVFKKIPFAVGDLPALRAIECNIILGLNVFSRTRLVLCMSTKDLYLQTFV